MKLLLDTQVLLWAIYKPERLPVNVARRLANIGNELLVSDVSLWEAGIKLAKRRLEYESELAKLLKQIDALTTVPLPITREHIEAAVQLPLHHGDPFDRLLIAQAHVERVALVSADAEAGKYDVPILWRE